MITGADTVIYSDAQPQEVFNAFEKALAVCWPGMIKEVVEFEEVDQRATVYYRDDEMEAWHDENGYELNAAGESAVCLGVNAHHPFERNVVIKSHESEDGFQVDDFEAQVIMSHIQSYYIVTPELPATCAFSNQILDMLKQALRNHRPS